ncbi:hypothetical protein BKA67DRAFT_614027 [Truncatella angustata]|uniref:Carrier domain-containing protein n=1 Tax=Truncatella angustata TaxID=152316 RepID=A0A9P8RFZ4_9PEZI|nr:uncharacterized protein BKA67DRAFT_614027 [Truncatella angustata]KAH6645134.1 hypothetical protein BKA67DRAFT_614027 [Truncatella angustata]
MRFGTPLFRVVLVGRNLVLTTHHAISDGGTYHRLFDNISRVYHGQSIPPYAEFKLFVKHCLEIEENTAKSFWGSRFNGQPTVFPKIDVEYIPDASKRLVSRIEFGPWGLGVPLGLMSSYVETAWAITAMSYTNSQSIAFGRVLSGRVSGLNGLESTLGPTIVTMPVQVNLKGKSTIAGIIRERAQERREALKSPALHYGLTRIRHVNEAARVASAFTALLNFRTPTDSGRDYSNSDMEIHGEYEPHLPYGLGISIVVNDTGLSVETLFDENVVCKAQTLRILRQFEHILHFLLKSPGGTQLEKLQLLNPHDRREIFEWNETIPNPPLQSLHNMFRGAVKIHPNAEAIQGPDGHLNYKELDTISDVVASDLQYRGIGAEDAIGLVFEKSIWAIVAQLAVLKAGAVCVPIDPDFPSARKETIIAISKIATILTSSAYLEALRSLASEVLVIDAQSVSQLSRSVNLHPSGEDDSFRAAFILFTSGSTGTPKGHVLEHGNLVSSLVAIGRDMGWGTDVRMLQFASYVWDMSIAEIFGTLTSGGCVCIPSEEARESFIAEFIESVGVNCAIFTPTVLRMITPEEAPSMKTIMSIGEPVDLGSVKLWSGHARFFNAWGPSETACVSAMAELTPTSRYAESIGRPLASALWLVDENNVDKLVPIGGVGEIVVESPGVSRGYLNDPNQTAASFIAPPRWAPPRKESTSTKSQRMYRTGDLARYNPDGSLEYIGRRDNQVKISGQRVELAEIEKALAACSAVRSAITSIQTIDNGHKSLVAVVSLEEPCLSRRTPLKEVSAEFQSEVEEGLNSIRKALYSRVPIYMVPNVWRVVEELPRTASLKIDRSAVRSWLAQWEPTHFEGSGTDALTPPTNEVEQLLHTVWCAVLTLQEDEIGRESSFIKLGGDSILAINIATKCRKRGLRVSVATLLRSESLANVAAASELLPGHSDSLGERPMMYGSNTSLHQMDEKDTQEIFAHLNEIGVHEADVEVLLPCSPLQEGILFSQLKSSGRQYWMRLTMKLTPTSSSNKIDDARLMVAWEAVCQAQPSLRTILVSCKTRLGTFQQAVLSKPQVSTSYTAVDQEKTDIDSILGALEVPPFAAMQPPHHLHLVRVSGDVLYAILHINHALFDERSMRLVGEQLSQAYDNPTSLPKARSLSQYFSWVVQRNEVTHDYWTTHLSGVTPCLVPLLDAVESKLMDVDQYLCDVPIDDARYLNLFCRHRGLTVANLLQTAWCIVLRQCTRTEGVVFGFLRSDLGPMEDAENMMGPLLAMAVCKFEAAPDSTLTQILRDLSSNLSHALEYGTCPLSDIHEAVGVGQLPLFNTIMTIYRLWPDNLSRSGSIQIEHLPLHGYTEYPLTLGVGYDDDNIVSKLLYDPSKIPRSFAKNIANLFASVITNILANPEQTLRSLESSITSPLCAFSAADIARTSLSDHEASLLQAWNRHIPAAVDTCVHEQTRIVAGQHIGAPAIYSWDYELNHGMLDDLSDRMAVLLQKEGVTVGVPIPYFFEKSAVSIVVMLGILKAGGALLPMDINHPSERIACILSESCAPKIVTSFNLLAKVNAKIDAPKLIVVDMNLIQNLAPGRPAPVDIKSSDTCYIIYTSGSTGKPKGTVITHSNFSTSLKYRRDLVKMTPETRTLQYLNFIFDVSMFDIFLTLVSGGCVCMPSQHEWFNDIAGAIRRTRANFVFLTPSLATLLNPSEVPTLRTLGLTGESFENHIIEQWKQIRVLNMYGPAEATVHSSGCEVSFGSGKQHLNIGRPDGCLYWVVDPNDHNKLMSIGCPGELLIQGPIVSPGYLGNPSLTSTVFIEPPSWISRFKIQDHSQNGISSSGIKPSQRCYKTGDIAIQTPDGSVIYQGRKDTQVKLNGLRIELGEIEYHIRRVLKAKWVVAVELIKPSGQDDNHCLAVFLAIAGPDQPEASKIACKVLPPVQKEASALRSALTVSLPTYMVPQFFVHLEKLPLTRSGKTDRSLLRKTGAMLSPRQLSLYDPSQETLNSTTKLPPSIRSDSDNDTESYPTCFEDELRRLWSETLALPCEAINKTDDFFNIGGSSIRAMRLAHAAHRSGILLSAADVFKSSTLSDMATVARRIPSSMASTRSDRSMGLTMKLIQSNPFLASSRAQVASSELIHLVRDNIESIAEATDAQADMVAVGELDGEAWHNEFTIEAPSGLNVSNLIKACESIVHHHRIFRTTFVQFGSALYQITVKKATLGEMITIDGPEKRPISCPVNWDTYFPKFHLSELSDDGKTCHKISLKIHHAHYDAISVDVVLQDLRRAYSGRALSTGPHFYEWLSHVESVNLSASEAYWKQVLEGSSMTNLVSTSVPATLHFCRDSIQFRVPLRNVTTTYGTPSSVVQAAWALVLSRATGQSDVIFCGPNANRSLSSFPDTDRVSGMCLNFLPVRACLQNRMTLGSLVKQMHDQAVAAIPHQHLGFRSIIRNCTDWPTSTRFSSMLIYQNHDSLRRIIPFQNQDCVLTPHGKFGRCADILVEATPSPPTWNATKGQDEAKELVVDILYSHENFTGEQVKWISHFFSRVLESIPQNLEQPIERYDEHASKPYVRSCSSAPPKSSAQIAPNPSRHGKYVIDQAWDEVGLSKKGQTVDDDCSVFSCGGDLVTALLLSRYYRRTGHDISMQYIIDNPTRNGQSGLIVGAEENGN